MASNKGLGRGLGALLGDFEESYNSCSKVKICKNDRGEAQ